MDSIYGFNNNQGKLSMFYSDTEKGIALNKVPIHLLERGKENMMQEFTEGKSPMLSFDPSPSLGSKAAFGEPSQRRMLDYCYSHPLLGHLHRSDTSYCTLDDTTGGMQAKCHPSPRKREPFTSTLQGLNHLSLSQTHSRLYDNELTHTFPRGHSDGLAETLPNQSLYDGNLTKRLPPQTCYESGLDKIFPIQNRYNSGLPKASKFTFQPFNQVESSQGLRMDYYSQSLPVQLSGNGVPPPLPDKCTKRGTNCNFQEACPSLRRINEHAAGTFQGNSLYKNISFDDSDCWWYSLPSTLLAGDAKIAARIISISHLEDPIRLNVFLSGPLHCGQYELLKTFVKRNIKLPKSYDFRQGFVARIDAYGREISIEFSIIQNLWDCREKLIRMSVNRKCVLVLVYSLNLSITLHEIDAYMKSNKQYFIESKVPIILVGNTSDSNLSARDTDNRYLPTYEGGSDIWTKYSEVMKAFCKCSQKTGENVDQMFSLAMKSALGIWLD